MASGDIHLIGSFLVFVAWYTFSAYTLRDNPKSAILTSLPSQTRTFLAARSRCTNPLRDKNSYAELKEGTFRSLLMKRKTMICEKGHQSITFNITDGQHVAQSLQYARNTTRTIPFAICHANVIKSAVMRISSSCKLSVSLLLLRWEISAPLLLSLVHWKEKSAYLKYIWQKVFCLFDGIFTIS